MLVRLIGRLFFAPNQGLLFFGNLRTQLDAVENLFKEFVRQVGGIFRHVWPELHQFGKWL